MAALPIGAWADDNNVSTITTWTFNSIDNGTTYSTYDGSYNYIAVGNNDLYARVLLSANCTFTVNELATSQEIEFADGHKENVTKVINQKTKVRNPNYILSTATASQVVSGIYDKKNETQDTEYNYNGTGMLAFNTTVGGTIYVAFKSSGSATKGFRIYHKDFGTKTTTVVGAGHSSSTVLNNRTFDTNSTLQYVSATTESAGTFFIGDVSNSCDIYAVRFVPVIKTTIGSHGKSSFSCAQGLDFSNATPDGLKAYKAKEVNGDGLVVLSSVDEAPAGTGLILLGEPDTEYTIPVKDNATGVGDNLMVGTITETAVAASTSSVHNYIWAYTASGLGFYNVDAATTSAAGKAYLSTGATALNATTPARGFIFEDEDVTGIDVVKGSELKANGEYFNLNGQRVAQPTKGLYIVNGKKVVIK